MKHALSVALVLCLIGAGFAFAQSGVGISSSNAPIDLLAKPDSKDAAAPVPGANSFTESEARSRLQANGYREVSGLIKDDQSIWRGKATMDGMPVDVALDFKGNIVAR